MKFRISQLLLFFLLISAVSQAQNVGINTETPDGSAALEVFSTNGGVLVPRLSSAQRLSISSPADGLFLWDTDSSNFMYYALGAWHQIYGDVESQWINAGGNIYNGNAGNVGMGTSSPNADLHVADTLTNDPAIQLSNSTHDYLLGIDPATGVMQIGEVPSLGGASIFIDTLGRVGIGNSSPSGNLDVHNPAGNLEINWSSPGRHVIVGIDETEGVLNIGHAPSPYTDGKHLAIDSIGRIGIGTDAPQSMLHLDSDSSAAEISFSDNLGTRSFTVGIEPDSGAFVIAVDSASGIQKPILSVSDDGAVYLEAPDANQDIHVKNNLVAESIQLSGTYSPGDVLTVDGSGNLVYMAELRTPIIDLYNTDSFDLADVWTDMVWDGQRIVDADYTMQSLNRVIRIETAGTYRVDYTMGASLEDDNHEIQLLGRLLLNTGGGYNEVVGSRMFAWFNHYYAMTTTSRTLYLDLNAGDQLKMQVYKTDNKQLIKKPGGFGFSMQRVHH